MKLLKPAGLLLLMAFLSVSCKNYKLEKKLKKFIQHEIVVPNNLRQIAGEGDEPEIIDTESVSARLIVYVDSLECSSCKVGHMYEYNEITDYRNVAGEQYLPMFIFSPPGRAVKELLYRIRSSHFEYPVFLDESGAFPKANPHVLADSRFHTFLLDKNGRIILVGDPVRNQPLWELYKTTIKQLIDNEGVLP